MTSAATAVSSCSGVTAATSIGRRTAPRGSYGGDVWQVWYRSLDTLDIASLNPQNMPGRDLWVVPGGFRDRRVPNFDSTDPELKPMSQDSFNAGAEYQLNDSSAIGIHYVHNDLVRTIEDIGALDASGNEAYIIGNPGESLATIQAPSGATPIGQPLPKPKRQYDALELTYSRRFANNWFGNASYVLSRLYGNYSGIASSDRSHLSRAVSAAARLSRARPALPGRAATPIVTGTSTNSCGTRGAISIRAGVSPPIARTS